MFPAHYLARTGYACRAFPPLTAPSTLVPSRPIRYIAEGSRETATRPLRLRMRVFVRRFHEPPTPLRLAGR